MLSALKEGAASCLVEVPRVKSEPQNGVHVVDVQGPSHSEPKDKGPALAPVSTLSVVVPLPSFVQATQTVLAFLGTLPAFEPLWEFEVHL